MSRVVRNAEAFHAANPKVMVELVRMARQAQKRGATKVGIGMLFEVVRWRMMLRTVDENTPAFKVNNDCRSWYARRIMSDHPDLDGIFYTRQTSWESDPAVSADAT